MGFKPGPATISPCTFTMDHNTIIYFMTDGLTRGPDKDVHVPSVPRPRVIGGSASPRSPEFFQKTFPLFNSFSKVYYARIDKSPLISALFGALWVSQRYRIKPARRRGRGPAVDSIYSPPAGGRSGHGGEMFLVCVDTLGLTEITQI